MNIFFLHNHPTICATMHNDKHCVKMILESAQMLSTAHRILDGKLIIDNSNNRIKKMYLLSKEYENVIYKPTHINHPCNVWLRQSIINYRWLYSLFISLCDEYTFRYGKIHKCDTLLRDVLINPPKNIPHVDFTQPALAMPDQYKCDSYIDSYRRYYIHEKAKISTWKKRSAPDWYTKAEL